MLAWASGSCALALFAASHHHAGADGVPVPRQIALACSIKQVSFAQFGPFATFMP